MNKTIVLANLNYFAYKSSNRVYSVQGLSPTLITCQGGYQEVKIMINNKIRKLTEREYFRLMGFSDKDVNVLKDNGFSKTQMYKMAGNSIVVNVLEALFKQLLPLLSKDKNT